MRRREFITLLGALTIAGPPAADAADGGGQTGSGRIVCLGQSSYGPRD